MSAILVIDDEQNIREVFKDILEDEGYRVFVAENGRRGLALLKQEEIDLVFLDIWLPGMGGLEILQKIQEEFEHVEVAIISGHANIEIAVKAIKMGAYDILEKPLGIDRILLLCRNVLELEKLRRENKSLKSLVGNEMLGRSPALEKIRSLITHTTDNTATVLITGENGTGKELVAREIHNSSTRAHKAFIPVNCAAIPETLIESELFGHEKGSFTGAYHQKKGKFELASGGTIFLDEIADLALSAQAKILRAIQEQRIERVGSEKFIQVDVRIVAATNRNMMQMVQEGRFREDLYYRLNVLSIEVPPLRERVEDIETIAKHVLSALSLGTKRLSESAMQELCSYSWPGNIRQLKNVLQRLAIFSEENLVEPADVHNALEGEMQDQATSTKKHTETAEDKFKDYQNLSLVAARELFEADFIRQKLKECEYNISKTAQILGMYPSNLHNKINKYGISLEGKQKKSP